MPIYEYFCSDCDRSFEVTQKITDGPLTSCPTCGSTHIRKLISLSSFKLKGTGWYATDYAGSKSNGKAPKGSPGEKPAESAAKKASDDSAKGETSGEKQPSSAEASKTSKPEKPGSSSD